MQNRQKLMHINQENDLKPHFGPFLAHFLALLIILGKSGSVTNTHERLACCKKK